MTIQLRGCQTQFYIDLVYGVAFSVGFGYLLFFGMDPRVAAFEGGSSSATSSVSGRT